MKFNYKHRLGAYALLGAALVGCVKVTISKSRHEIDIKTAQNIRQYKKKHSNSSASISATFDAYRQSYGIPFACLLVGERNVKVVQGDVLTGFCSIELPPGKYWVRGRALSHIQGDAGFVKVAKGDSVVINFLLRIDEQ